jgi:sugar lactone lactonase YvrE
VAVDKSGNVYVADKDNFVIRQITADGRVTTIAGKPGEPGFADGSRGAARFKDPHGIAVDYFGNIYVADTANQAVRRISASGDVTSIALGLSNPESIALDSAGTVYVTDSRGVHKISNGKVELVAPLLLTSSVDGPVAHADSIAVDSHGTLYIADTAKNIVCWQTR